MAAGKGRAGSTVRPLGSNDGGEAVLVWRPDVQLGSCRSALHKLAGICAGKASGYATAAGLSGQWRIGRARAS